MLDLLSRVFGSERALQKTVDNVARGLDALVYTDEERAAAAAKDRSEARAMVVQWMAATQGQNLARRLIALAVTATWLGTYLIGFALSAAAVFADDSGTITAAKLQAASEIASRASSEMNSAVMLILAFYFAAPHMGTLAKAVTNRFASKGVK